MLPLQTGHVSIRSNSRQWQHVQCAKAAKGFGKKKAAAKPPAKKGGGKTAVKQAPARPVSAPKPNSRAEPSAPAPEPSERPTRLTLPRAPNPSPDTNRPDPFISLPASMPDLNQLEPVGQDEKDFAARLQAVKQAGRLKAQEKAAQAASAPLAVLDAEPNLYDNPPPLTDTLMKELNSGISDPSMQTQSFGPSQIGVAAGALALVGVLVFTSVGGFSNSSRYKGIKPSKPPPDEFQAALLANTVEKSRDALADNPKDEAALEALGFAYSDLYQFEDASNTFAQLAELPSRQQDALVWKLYGESSLLAEKPGKAVAAFSKAWELQGNDFNILTSLTNAYIANGDYSKAADEIQGVQQRLKAGGADGGAAAQQPVAQAAPEAAAPAGAAAAPVAETSAAGSTTPAEEGQAQSSGAAGSSFESAAEVVAAIESTSRDAGSQTDGDAAAGATAAAPSAPSQDTPAPSTSQQQAADSSSSEGAAAPSKLRALVSKKAKKLDPVGVDLLLGKVYSAWRGHDNEATATYDTLIKEYPEDFRGYLAKAVFLRDRGRGVEAKKMFLQARYYTPTSQQGLIDRIQKGVDDVPSKASS